MESIKKALQTRLDAENEKHTVQNTPTARVADLPTSAGLILTLMKWMTGSGAPSRVPTLITIGISHYCERVRWALDLSGAEYVEFPHPPGLHIPFTNEASGGVSSVTPMLVHPGGAWETGSAILLAGVDDEYDLGLFPPDLGDDMALLLAYFDDMLGAPARAAVYAHVLPDIDLFVARASRCASSGMEAAVLGKIARLIRAGIKRSMRIGGPGSDADQLARSQVEAVFDVVDELLADGRRFLLGTPNLSAADISFASLAYPAILPLQMEDVSMGLEHAPEDLRIWAESLRKRPAGQFVLRMYDEHRPVDPSTGRVAFRRGTGWNIRGWLLGFTAVGLLASATVSGWFLARSML